MEADREDAISGACDRATLAVGALQPGGAFAASAREESRCSGATGERGQGVPVQPVRVPRVGDMGGRGGAAATRRTLPDPTAHTHRPLQDLQPS